MAGTPASYSDFANYGVDPWNNITLNERPWYDPVLRDIYLRNSVYSQHVTMKVDMNGPKARTIYFNDIIPPRPNIQEINPRLMDATRLYTDSFQRSVTTARYGNGMAVHRESQMFSYWQKNGAQAGLLNIIQNSLGQVIVDHMDLLARNAFYAHPYPIIGLNNASSFAGLSSTTDIMTTNLVDEIWLALHDRQKPYSAIAQGYVTGDEVICITTAGAVYDLKREVGTGTGGLNFVDINKYTDEGRTLLIKGELGMYRGVRFVDNPMARLWNAGDIEVTTAIKAAVTPGSGAPDPATTLVEGTRKVGQPGSTHSITVASTVGFVAGDMITIHKLKHDAGSVVTAFGAGTIDGPKVDDPMRQDVEIAVVIDSTHLSLKEPYMMTTDNGAGLETDLGGTVYGYVTRAKTIHSALFLTPGLSSNALVAGVAQPPVIYMPPAIDDYLSINRVTYDFWMKYQLWDARAYHLAYLRGSNSLIGKRVFK